MIDMEDGLIPNLTTWPTRVPKNQHVATFTVPGEPVSKQRPRLARNKNGTVYTPKKTAEAEFDIQVCMKAANPNLFPDDGHSFGIRCLFIQATRQRRDVDNMVKMVLDAANGMVWKDDAQVEEIIGLKAYGDQPETRVFIYTRGDALSPSKMRCMACGKQFFTYPSWPKRAYCSRPCASLLQQQGKSVSCAHCAKELYRQRYRIKDGRNYFCNPDCKSAYSAVERTCGHCGTIFHQPRSSNRAGKAYCTKQCNADAQRNRRAIDARGICSKCSGPTTKKKYTQCRGCRISPARPIHRD